MSASELIAAFKSADFTLTDPLTYRSKPNLWSDFPDNFFSLLRSNGIDPNAVTITRDSMDPRDCQAAFIDGKDRIVLDHSVVETIKGLGLKL